MFAVQFEGWLYSALKAFLLKQKTLFSCVSVEISCPVCRGWFAPEGWAVGSQGFGLAEVMGNSTGKGSADGKVTCFFQVCTVPVGARFFWLDMVWKGLEGLQKDIREIHYSDRRVNLGCPRNLHLIQSACGPQFKLCTQLNSWKCHSSFESKSEGLGCFLLLL